MRGAAAEQVSRVVFCSGKIYYDLLAGREQMKAAGAAIVRVEQIYPFPAQKAAAILARYPNAAQVIWAQEEPENMGAWRFLREQLAVLAGGREIHYRGRAASASTATGSAKRHQQEQTQIVEQALAG